MDAKSRANFINSVVGEQKILCPSCNTLNVTGSLFCMVCGKKLINETKTALDFENTNAATQFDSSSLTREEKSEEDVFPITEKSQSSLDDSVNVSEMKSIVKRTVDVSEPVAEVAEESVCVFAQGLPDWDIVPPHIMVRRKIKK